MKPKCPYCGSEVDQLPFYLNKRQLRIYTAVAAARYGGISTDELVQRMYGPEQKPAPSAPGQLRTAIHGLNEIIKVAGQHIDARHRNMYRLYSTKGDLHGATTDQAEDRSSHTNGDQNTISE